MELLNCYALDKDFKIVSLLAYTNLQWTRNYYESGKFSIEIPFAQYDSNMKYIYCNNRDEVGLISQINYIESNNYKSFHLSGYFLENQLNRRIAYKLCTGNILNAPTWINSTGKAEDVAFAYFEAFKDLTYKYNDVTYNCNLGINVGKSLSRGNACDHERDDTELGAKIYTILKPSEMSYRIVYDFVKNTKIFECWKGLDRTVTNTDGNNPIIFGTKWGNIKNANVLIDESSYKNGYVSSSSETQDNVTTINTYVNTLLDGDITVDNINFTNVSASVNKSDYSTTNEYIEAIHQCGRNALSEKVKKINIDFTAITGSYEYRKDFDLGDKCSIQIPEINLNADAILIGCYEVIKQGVNTLTLEFGEPILK